MSIPNATKLSSFREWSIEHITNIFETPSDDDCLRFIRETFADDVTATINGTPLPRQGLDTLVQVMRKSSKSGLSVEWGESTEVARDPNTNRASIFYFPPSRAYLFISLKDGELTGFYVIRGLTAPAVSSSDKPVDVERRKTVRVVYVFQVGVTMPRNFTSSQDRIPTDQPRHRQSKDC